MKKSIKDMRVCAVCPSPTQSKVSKGHCFDTFLCGECSSDTNEHAIECLVRVSVNSTEKNEYCLFEMSGSY